MLLEINKEELFHAEQGTCLVEFYTPTCPHCKELEKTLERMKGEERDLRFYKMDVSEKTDVARELGIRSVPTLIRFENGKPVEKLVGNRSENEIRVLLQGK